VAKPILSLRDLSWRIGVPIEQLRKLAADIERHPTSQYHELAIPQGKDKFRMVRPPSERLKAVQRRIVKRVLVELGYSGAAHGGVPGRSTLSNAAVHRGQRTLAALDVKKFYDNVDHRRVYRMLRDEQGFGHDVARLLTRLTTLKGALPQGAASSPSLANVFMTKAVDDPLERLARAHGLRYTRYVDDLAFSGERPQVAINEAARLLSARGLKLNKKKIHVAGRENRQVLTGLIVNDGERVSIPKRQRDRIRAAIHELKQAKLVQREFEKAVRSIRGRIAYVERFHAGDGRRLGSYLDEVLKMRA
jgi:retron-type reverse transcriptase